MPTIAELYPELLSGKKTTIADLFPDVVSKESDTEEESLRIDPFAKNLLTNLIPESIKPPISSKDIEKFNPDRVATIKTVLPKIPEDKMFSLGVIDPIKKAADEYIAGLSEPTGAYGKKGESQFTGLGRATVSSPALALPAVAFGMVKKIGKEGIEKAPKIIEAVKQEAPDIVKGVRQFVETVKASKLTKPEVATKLVKEIYETRSTSELAQKARNLVKEAPDIAENIIQGKKLDDNAVAIAMEMIKHKQDVGDIDGAVKLVEDIAPKLTELGRSIQAISIYNKLSPDGVLRFAQSIINKGRKAGSVIPDLSPNTAQELIGLSKSSKQKQGELIKLTREVEDAVKSQVKGFNLKQKQGELIKLTREVEVENKKLVSRLMALVPSSTAQKISTIQTMAQLLNPKTLIRNVVGNLMFQGVENISQAIATPIDKAVSLLTKERTTGFPSIMTQLKGAGKGLKEGLEDAVLGIDTLPGVETKFGLPSQSTFKMGEGKTVIGKTASNILGGLEKAMNVSLKATDRMAYQSAFEDSIRMQQKLKKTNEITSSMIEQAHQTGLYRTFQDKNVVSDFFVRMKKTLNMGQKFGLGDFVLKYPKTPGNLLARALDYTPFGLVKNFMVLADGTKGFNQKKFVDSVSRALVGTTGIGVATILAKKGAITEMPSKDIDTREMQKISGQGGYQVNASAIKRFVMSGFNPNALDLQKGDTLVSYDWAQPIAINMALGAKIASKPNVKSASSIFTDPKTLVMLVEGLTAGSETLSEQPLLRGVSDFFNVKDKGIGKSLSNVAKGMPASFVPTILSQFAQKQDNIARSTTSPDIVDETINRVKAKIPGLRQTLPSRINVFGEKAEQYKDNGNTIFNVFFNPAFVNKYNPSKEAKEVIELMQITGENKQMPRYIGKRLSVGAVNLDLKPAEIYKMQRFVGYNTKNVISQLMKQPEYQKMTPEEKVKEISSYLTDITKAAKQQYFQDMPLEERSDKIIEMLGTLDSINKKEKLLNYLYDSEFIGDKTVKEVVRKYSGDKKIKRIKK